MTLAGQTCIPCKTGTEPLSTVDIAKLLPQIPGWVLADNARSISREYTFSNFKHALQFVNKVGVLAEEQKHHPDIALGWGYVRLTLQTHTVNGLHSNDFILAAKINTIT